MFKINISLDYLYFSVLKLLNFIGDFTSFFVAYNLHLVVCFFVFLIIFYLFKTPTKMKYFKYFKFIVFMFPILFLLVKTIFPNITFFIADIYCDSDDNNDSSKEASSSKDKNKTNSSENSWFKPTISHSVKHDVDKSIVDTLKEGINESANVVSDAIKQASDKIGGAVLGGTVGGAVAYAVKISAIPPAAKAGLIVSSAVAAPTIQTFLTSLENNLNLKDISNPHPTSPTETPLSDISKSSLFDFLDVATLLNVDPNNIALHLIFSLLVLSFCTLFILYSLTMNLFFLHISNKNLELKLINKYLPEKYADKIIILILKILQKANKGNKIFIITALLMLIIINCVSTYGLYNIYLKFDKFIDLYLKYKNLK